jgi:hypothetical protein
LRREGSGGGIDRDRVATAATAAFIGLNFAGRGYASLADGEVGFVYLL